MIFYFAFFFQMVRPNVCIPINFLTPRCSGEDLHYQFYLRHDKFGPKMNLCIGKFKFCRKEFTIIGASGIIQGDQGRSKGLKKYQAGIWQLRFCAIFEKQTTS